MTQSFFVTATGTDIGKTFVTSTLIRQLKKDGASASALKPIISGWDIEDHNNDTYQLIESLGLPYDQETIDEISPWRFTEPLSPHMAAKAEKQIIDSNNVVEYCKNYTDSQQSDYHFIEGVGGVIVPINDQYTTLDLMRDLSLPIILVAGSYLGTISHTLTAYQCLVNEGLTIAAIIVSESPNNDIDLSDTCQTIESFTNQNVILLPRTTSLAPTIDLSLLIKRNTGY